MSHRLVAAWGLAFVCCAVAACGADDGPVVDWTADADVPPAIADDTPPSLPSLTVAPGFGMEGGALALQSLDVDVKVFGRLARTQVTQVFASHLPRQSEGVYEMTLPEGAVLSRLAMDVDGKMVEGELAEKERARAVYEQIVRGQKDPALLEWQGGNRFKMQVFPIPANGTKTIILAYEEVLPLVGKSVEYAYGLPSVAKAGVGSSIGALTFALDAAHTALPVVDATYAAVVTPRASGGLDAALGGGTVKLTATSFVPKGPVRVSFARPSGDPLLLTGGKDSERMFLVDVRPSLPPARGGAPEDLVVAIDTSRGIGGKELARVVEVTNGLLEGRSSRDVRIVYGDLAAHTCVRGSLDDARACLAKLDAGGATNLEALLVAATQAAGDLDDPAIVLFTDGAASLGELDGDVLRGRFISALKEANDEATVFTVAVGHAPDTSFLASLAAAGKGQALRMSPSANVATTIHALDQSLRVPMFTDVTVKVVDGEVDALTSLPLFAPAGAGVHLRPGEPLAVVGRLHAAPLDAARPATLELRGTWDGKEIAQRVIVPASAPSASDVALVTHLWARGRVAELERAGAPRADVVAASLRYGVMSKATSFLVLENDAAYQRFQIERRQQSERDAALRAAEPQHDEQRALDEGLMGKLGAANLQKGTESLASRMMADGASGGQWERGRDEPEEAKPAAAPPPESARRLEAKPLRMAAEKPGKLELESALPKWDGVDDDEHLEAALQSVRGARVGIGGAASGLSTSGINAVIGPRIGRVDQDVVTTQGTPVILGSLDKELVRRVVSQHIGEVQYCYEKQLRSAPALFGKIKMKWVINGEGRVTQSQTEETQMHNADVEHCLAAKIRTWRFPKPKGGGIVIVSYPFVFRSSGGFDEMFVDPRVALEKKLKGASITVDERMALVALRIRAGALESADALFAQTKKLLLNDASRTATGASQLALLDAVHRDSEVSQRYGADIDEAAVALAATGVDDPRAVRELVGVGKVARVPSLFGKKKLGPDEAGAILRELVASNEYSAPSQERVDAARALIAAWKTGGATDTELYRAIARWPNVATRLPDETAAAALGLMRADKAAPIEDGVFRTWLSAAGYAPSKAMRSDLDELCRLPSAPVRACMDAVRALQREQDDAQLKALADALQPRMLDAVRAARREDLTNDALLLEEVALLEARDATSPRNAEAVLRTLSEMVEFAPHDATVRLTYAGRLVDRHALVPACEAYGHATQLEPSRRDLFKKMMLLRRGDDGIEGDDVRACIVNAVSRLPVQRALSLVLTWEDPDADVDLHVEGPTGEIVFFKNQSGKDGGLLYYDVTDGYGPEIYTLGDRGQGAKGEPGPYRISLVYYRGSTTNVKAKLTILENAGTPAEKRREVPFTLKEADKDNRITVAEID